MASRKHAEMIKKWLDNPDCEVWFIDVNHGKEWRKVTGNPLWGQGDRYVVVLPEYKEAWQAYLDDELETKFEYEDEWHGWGREYVVPMFSSPPECYRRKPKPEKREPLECWVAFEATENLVEDEIQTVHVYDHDQSENAIRYATRHGLELAFVREVIEPEIKELPDSKGVWWCEDSGFPVLVTWNPIDGELVFSEFGSQMMAGPLSDLVGKRWIKVENPFKGG